MSAILTLEEAMVEYGPWPSRDLEMSELGNVLEEEPKYIGITATRKETWGRCCCGSEINRT